MEQLINGETFYGKGEYKDNYDGLDAEKQIEVDLFRAGQKGEVNHTSPIKPSKIPQNLVKNLMDKYSHDDIINLLLDAQAIKGLLREKLFNNYAKNVKKQTVCEKYLDEIFYRK